MPEPQPKPNPKPKPKPKPALILVGHGSARNPDSGAPTRRHAETLRASGRFSEVRVAFWKEEPFYRDALTDLDAEEVFVVPNLACKGFITGEVIPREMLLTGETTTRSNGQKIHLCAPVGTHPRIAQVIADRVKSIAAEHGLTPETTGILLAAHGNAHNTASSIQTERVADLLLPLGVARETAVVFLEVEPKVETWQSQITTPNVVAVPFMISNGVHGAEDIPELLGLDPKTPEMRAMKETGVPAGPYELGGRKLWYCRAVGSEPVVAEVVVDLVEAARTTFR